MERGITHLRDCTALESHVTIKETILNHFRDPSAAALLVCQLVDYRSPARRIKRITMDEADRFAAHCEEAARGTKLDEFAILDFFSSSVSIDLVNFLECHAPDEDFQGDATLWSEHKGKLALLRWWLESREPSEG